MHRNLPTALFGEDGQPIDVVAVDFRQSLVVADTTYRLLVDLSNPDGAYLHEQEREGLRVYYFSANIVKTSVAAQWVAFVGTVLRVDEVSADIAWVEPMSLHNQDTGVAQVRVTGKLFPIPLDLTVDMDTNKLHHIAPSFVETVTALNTLTPIDDALGNPQTLAVGDLVLWTEKQSGAGAADTHHFICYLSEDQTG